ncbi:MAG: type IV pilus secretin PilQ [Desulfatibacillaceae bacterium]
MLRPQNSYRVVICMGLAVAMLTLPGCGSNEKARPDPFFNKWQTMALESMGHSPKGPATAEKKVTDLGESPGQKKLAVDEPEEQPPELPKKPVTLKMKNANVDVVLRALARGAGQNIIINSTVRGKVSIDVRRVPWRQVFTGLLRSQGLEYAWEGRIIRVMDSSDIKASLELDKLKEEKRKHVIRMQETAPIRTAVVKVHYADPYKLKENLVGQIPGATEKDEGNAGEGSVYSRKFGSVDVNEHNNALVIRARPDVLDKMLALVDRLDRPTAQVRIQANIVETNHDTARELGVQWGGMYGQSNVVSGADLFVGGGGTNGQITGGPNAPLEGQYNPRFGPGISGQGFGVNFPADFSTALSGANLGILFGRLGSSVLEMQLTALAEENKVDILSSPTITTLDNQKAFTENGSRVPYVSTDVEGNREVKFVDAVLRLEITPHVIDEDHLKMNIGITKDEVDLSRTVDGNPFIFKKLTETSLIVRNGETIVISGLTKTRESDSDRGIPWLRDIPVLGRLFSAEGLRDEMEEVLIFVTPTILPPFTDPTRESEAG